MTTEPQPNNWQVANGAYLSAALAWLRLCLRREAQDVGRRLAEPTRRPWSRIFHRTYGGVRDRVTTAKLKRAAEAMDQAAQIDPPPALVGLSEALELSPFELRTLLLCAAPELDPSIPFLCAAAQGDPHLTYPTFSLALALWSEDTGGAGWEAVLPDRPLRYWRLIQIYQAAAQLLITSPLRADERIVNYLKGLNYLDDRLGPLLVPFDPGSLLLEPLPDSQQAVIQAIRHQLDLAARSGQAPILQLVGSDSLSKQLLAREALAGRRLLYRLHVELLPDQAAELETIARLWQREAILLPLALYLDAQERPGAPDSGNGQPPALRRLLARDLGLVLLDTREIEPGLGRYGLPVDVEKPTPAEQQAVWSKALGPGTAGTAAQLAAQFDLNLPTIRQIAWSVRADLQEGEAPPAGAVWQACLVQTRPRLDRLARRIEPKAGWDDIVLPDEPLELLHQIAAQVRQRTKVYDEWGFRQKMNRGLGITTLFSGESGTGKTMAAEVIADELKLNLYRIDLSAVVSKYIGETEKNLRQVFDAAEDGGAILFFDEADAIFGKRSEVKDSHDRYANIEVNYLLQRMEAYRGLAILATNMKSALDQAFLRRLRFIVVFPFPDEAHRRLIWEGVFPAASEGQAPIVEWPDYEALARLPLTGGSIHNTALNAAFLAAQAGTPVTMPLLFKAALAELRKLERPASQANFRPPATVQARRERWVRLLAGLNGDTIDYDRLAWWDLDDAAIERVAAHAARTARESCNPLTTDHLAEAAAPPAPMLVGRGQRTPEEP